MSNKNNSDNQNIKKCWVLTQHQRLGNTKHN
jgi:hypothetical protein